MKRPLYVDIAKSNFFAIKVIFNGNKGLENLFVGHGKDDHCMSKYFLEEAMIWRCSLCGYIYDEVPDGEKFENLPDDWLCSVCNVSKNVS